MMEAALFLPAAVAAFMILVFFGAVARLTGAFHDLTEQFRRATPAQTFTALALLASFFFVLYSIGDAKRSSQMAILRQQFRLPEDVTVAKLRVGKHSSAKRPDIEAIVQLTEAQLHAYIRQTEDRSLWLLGLRSYDGVPVVSYTSAAVRWSEPPVPVYAGDRRLHWSLLPERQGGQNDGGRVLCFVLVPAPDGAAAAYRAKGCSEVERSERIEAAVMGVVDTDAKILHMKIR